MLKARDFRSEVVLDALARRPDGAAVLALADSGAAVVGGFVRDTLLGIEPRELDVVVSANAEAFARRLGGAVVTHPAFGTARAVRDGWTIDVAAARRERYPQPGALPLVEPATLAEDLARRDFGANAIAVPLAGGALLAVAGALEDLAEKRLRVLHERSFIDDPTRVMRLARYRHRLGFTVEPRTAALAEAATLETVSGTRVAAELRLTLREPEPLAPLADLQGKLPIVVDRSLVERPLALAPADADRQLVIFAAIVGNVAPAGWLASLELAAHERDVLELAARAQDFAAKIAAAGSASALRDALRGIPVEVVAVAGALGPAAAARRWIEELRGVELEIGGDDLLAAGVPVGPEIGARLERTLRRKLDGELATGRAAELASALEEGSGSRPLGGRPRLASLDSADGGVP
jgi:tRNA nucleotidyltransferase (CCA-adding enzyme)